MCVVAHTYPHDSCATWFDDWCGGIFVNINTKLGDFFSSTFSAAAVVVHTQFGCIEQCVFVYAIRTLMCVLPCLDQVLVEFLHVAWVMLSQMTIVTAHSSLCLKAVLKSSFCFKIQLFLNLSDSMFDFSLKFQMSYLRWNSTWGRNFKWTEYWNLHQRSNFEILFRRVITLKTTFNCGKSDNSFG